jgi:hypothetical protein
MAGNGTKQGDAITEQKLEQSAELQKRLEGLIQRAKIRQEMASAEWENEDSAVIQMEVDKRIKQLKPLSDPPPKSAVGRGVRGFQKLTDGWPWYGKLTLALALIGAVVVVIVNHPNVAKIGTWFAGLW